MSVMQVCCYFVLVLRLVVQGIGARLHVLPQR
jgi:hypothetical protein